jgi:hypothetical protein
MSFEKEMQELYEWYGVRCDEYTNALENEGLHGLDSPLDALHNQDTKEYNRRLFALHEKYGMKVPEGKLSDLI